MRCNDEFDLRMGVGKMVQLFLVLLPGAAGHYHGAAAAKFMNAGHRPRLLGYFYYTVKAGIAAYRHVVDTNGPQQVLGMLVLHKEVGNAAQHFALYAAIPPEKALLFPEHAGD